MFLKDILAVSGQGGLFTFIKQGRNGIIIESMDTKKRINAHPTAKISSLEDITIFSTKEEDLPLLEVMKRIFEKEKGGQAINPKSSNVELKKYFEEVIPEYDKERVYVSDIKKVINWYNVLQKQDLISLDEEQSEESNSDVEIENKEDVSKTDLIVKEEEKE